MFQYSGGQHPHMTPRTCLTNCLSQQLGQRYDHQLVVGLTQGGLCLCGYDYDTKLAGGGGVTTLSPPSPGAGVEELPLSLCHLPCCQDNAGICR